LWTFSKTEICENFADNLTKNVMEKAIEAASANNNKKVLEIFGLRRCKIFSTKN
jgi:hypothetical protein